MQKKLIALAIASALTAPLAAQADVKLSGTLQAELVNVDGDATRENGLAIQDASTYSNKNGHNAGGIWITASEDLGNGLKGLAKFGLNINDQGLNEGADRDAYIGLAGGFGTVLAGRMNTPYKSLNWDPLNGTFMQARGNFGSTEGLLGHGSYLNNAVAYANSFGPVKVVAAIGVDEAQERDAAGTPTGDTVANHATSFSVVAPVGPVELGFAYLDASEYGQSFTATGAPTGQADDSTAMKLSARFKTGALSILGQYETRDAGAQPLPVGITAADLTADGIARDGETFMLVNVAYTMGNTMLSLGYGQNTQTFSGASDLDNTYTALGVIHKFSKTTRVHAGYSIASPDSDVVDTGDVDEEIFGVGMRVSF